MTFQAQETSAFGGLPVELYKFATANSLFLYTSAADEVAHNGETYKPLGGLDRTDPEQSSDLDRNTLKIFVPRDCPLVQTFIRSAPSTSTTVTIYRGHTNDPDAEIKPAWKGRFSRVFWRSKAQAEIECETLLTSLRRGGLQAEFQNLCNFTLYHQPCPVNRVNWRVGATVSAIAADTITIGGAHVVGHFAGGYVETADGDRRDIIDHAAGGVLTLTAAFPSTTLQAGDTVNAHAGCGHRHSDCVTKFGAETNNGEAFGGFPVTPTRNNFNTGLG